MKVKHVELWPGHVVTVLTVKHWHWVYKLFNHCFARASHQHEFIVLTEGSASEMFP